MNLTHRSGGPQSRTWRDIRPQPAPCLPAHRCSCPMTAGHPQPDHDGGRRYRQRRRLEPLKDHNCGMARVAHHAAVRWQPDGLGDVRCVLGRRRGGKSRGYRRPCGPVKPAQFRLNSLKRAVLPSSGWLLMPGESDEKPPYACGSRSDAISGAPTSPGHGSVHHPGTEDCGSRVVGEDRSSGQRVGWCPVPGPFL